MSLEINFNFLLQKVSFSGGSREIIRNNLPSPYGISILNDYVYWVDRNLKQVCCDIMEFDFRHACQLPVCQLSF